MTQVVPTTVPSSLRTNSRGPKLNASVAKLTRDNAEGEVRYDRTLIPLSTSGPDHGSLKKLFRFSEMQAPPAYERY
jgi:hypothetical protein